MGQRKGRERSGKKVPASGASGRAAAGSGAGQPGAGAGEPGNAALDHDAIPSRGGEDIHLSGPQIAHLLGISYSRVRQLTNDFDMPKVGEGLYPMRGCVLWYVEFWESRAKARMGDTTKTEGQHLKNQLTKAKLEEATGHLIPRKEVVDVWTSTFLRLGKWFDGLAASLGREMNWPADTIKVVRARLDEAREDFATDSAEYLDVVRVADAKTKPK